MERKRGKHPHELHHHQTVRLTRAKPGEGGGHESSTAEPVTRQRVRQQGGGFSWHPIIIQPNPSFYMMHRVIQSLAQSHQVKLVTETNPNSLNLCLLI